MTQPSAIRGLLLCAFVVACQPAVNVTPTAGPELLGRVRAACTTTTYSNCEPDALEAIRSYVPPVLIVICDLGDGHGKVVSTPSVEAAPATCSEGGTIQNTKVVVVIGVTDQSAHAGGETSPDRVRPIA